MSLVTLEEDNETENDAPVIEEEKVEVKVDAEDEKTPVDRPKPESGERKTRKERREEKKFDFQAELRRRDAEIERIRGESEARAREFAELRGRFEERHAKDGESAHESKLQELEDKANEHLAAAHRAGQANDQPRAAREMRAYYATIREMHRVDAKAAQAQEQPQQRQQDGVASIPPAVQEDIKRAFVDFPWLRTNDAARMQVDLTINQLTSAGYPNNYQTFAAAASHVAMRMKIGGDTGVSDAQKRRYAGTGSGEGDGGSGAPRTVKMGDHERAMARAWGQTKYPGISEEDSYRRWATEVGAKIQRQG